MIDVQGGTTIDKADFLKDVLESVTEAYNKAVDDFGSLGVQRGGEKDDTKGE